MPGLMSEEEFVERMNQIPVMHQKLDRLFEAINKIIENGTLKGIERLEDFPPIAFSESKATADDQLEEIRRQKLEEIRRLQQEADAIRDELDI